MKIPTLEEARELYRANVQANLIGKGLEPELTDTEALAIAACFGEAVRSDQAACTVQVMREFGGLFGRAVG